MWPLACTPPPALELSPSPRAPSVVLARSTAAGVTGVEVRAGDHGFEVPAEVGPDGVATAALVGLPAGEPFAARALGDDGPGEWVDGAAPALPDGVPGWSVALDDEPPDAAFLVVVTTERVSVVGLVDAAGAWRWWWPAPADRTFSSPRPTADGVLWSSQDRARADAEQLAHVRSLDGEVARDVVVTGAHHMVTEVEGGELAWLAWDTREVPWRGGEPERVTADRVRVGAGDGDEREVLAWFDDLGPAEVPCGHGTIPIQRGGEPTFEWTHANSLVWEPDAGLLLANARLTDELVAVDLAGDVAWILGGPRATVAFAEPGDAFSHAHFSDARPGEVLLFDNGVHRSPPSTRVLGLAIDARAGVATKVREVWLPLVVPFLGDVRHRTDGGLLVATSTPGGLAVYDAADRPTFRLQLDGDAVVGRVREWPALP